MEILKNQEKNQDYSLKKEQISILILKYILKNRLNT